MLEQGINIWGGEQFAPLFAALKRFFTELQSSLSQRYTIPTVTLTGDFEIEVDFMTTATTGFPNILSSSAFADGMLLYQHGANGTIQFGTRISGTETGLTGPIVNDGLLHTVNIKRVGNVFTMLTDGANSQSYTLAGTTCGVSFVGTTSLLDNLFNGIIANLKITDGTTLTHDLAFDEDFGTTSIAVNIGSIGAAGNATAVNITSSELFTLHTETDPDEWRNFDDTIIIPIAPQA